MTTTIQAKPNLAPDIFEYQGNLFRLSRTIDGTRKELSEEELAHIKEKLTSVIEEAISSGSFDINNIHAFDLNTCNNVLYVYNENEFGPWDGSIADQFVKIKKATIDAFTNIAASQKTSKKNPSSDSSISDFFEDSDDFKTKRSKVAQNFRDEKALIHAASLGTYTRMLESGYNNKGNSIEIFDPVIIQDLANFSSHPKVRDAINLFNLDLNLNTLYMPVHIGSYPGHPNGHWICAALRRQVVQFDDGTYSITPIAVVYDSLGESSFAEKLANFLAQKIGAEAENAVYSTVRHQFNGVDCGVHVVDFIDDMEDSHFDNLLRYLNDSKYKPNIPKERAGIAKIIEEHATEDLFQSGNAKNDLRTVKYYHLSKIPEGKFVGVDELKKIHAAQLEEFKKASGKKIRYAHFDWWTFPIKSESRYRNLYTLDNDAIKQLKVDEKFIQDYVTSAAYVLAAYGLELRQEDKKYIIEPSDEGIYEIPEIRLAKMAESFYLFNRPLYDALVQLSEDNEIIREIIKDERTKRAFALR